MSVRKKKTNGHNKTNVFARTKNERKKKTNAFPKTQNERVLVMDFVDIFHMFFVEIGHGGSWVVIWVKTCQ